MHGPRKTGLVGAGDELQTDLRSAAFDGDGPRLVSALADEFWGHSECAPNAPLASNWRGYKMRLAWSRGGDDGTRTHDPLLANTPEPDGGEQ
jgi:hypothetical protein